MAKTKYNLDDVVLCNAFDYHTPTHKSVQECTVSMITITRKGIRYRVKTKDGFQENFWENEIYGANEE